MDSTINLKLVVLGEGGVGKTSIVNTYLDQIIQETYLPTIGNITYKKDYKLAETEIKLSIWDSGGQRSFNPLNPALYSNIDIAILVFDLLKPKETLKNLKGEFLENINFYSEDVLTIIVGNKLDLLNKINPLKAVLQDFLTENDNFILMSAKTGVNVKNCFEMLIYTYLKKVELKFPENIQKNIGKEFLTFIKKNEKELKKNLVNLVHIEDFVQNIKIKPQIKEIEAIEKNGKDLKYYEFLKEELLKNETQKNDIFDKALINISELGRTIKYLQKSHSKSPIILVDRLKELLTFSMNDFEESVEFIAKLNREEFELINIISKMRKDLN
ncbi:MAG: Rab family GTPase [Candidatus Thorarchaeota archaeon]